MAQIHLMDSYLMDGCAVEARVLRAYSATCEDCKYDTVNIQLVAHN